MNISDAINTIESVAGVTDESTPVGEAWAAILRHIRSTPVAQSVPASERLPDNRDPECVANWPECWSGGYDPRCCRFPKSCSCERGPALPGEVES